MNETDYVITELEIVMSTDMGTVGRANFCFIDRAPDFPKVNKILSSIEDSHEAQVLSHHISVTEIDETTDLTGLEITKH